MIYDEGFEVNVDGYSFVAFSKFEMVGDPGNQKNVSHCDQTEVGWYRDSSRSQWGCYVARKAGSASMMSSESGAASDPVAKTEPMTPFGGATLEDAFAAPVQAASDNKVPLSENPDPFGDSVAAVA